MFGGTRASLGGVVGVVVVVAAVSGIAVADASNEAPLVEAGLDQSAPVNGTVYLDASGSRDPDGTIESYEWTVETPGGGNRDPQCADCAQTELVVRESGTYNVTVTVTDDDGATSSDTMQVDVSTVDGPSATLSGPTSVVANETVTVTATLTAGADPLSRVDWSVDGSHRARGDLGGESATRDLVLSLSPGNHTVAVEVYDELGRTGTATTWVNVTTPSDASEADSGGGPTGGDATDNSAGNGSADADSVAGNGTACSRYGGSNGETQHSDDTYCNNDRLIDEGTTLAIHDADNDGTVQWANVELGEEFAQNHDGVTVDVDGTVRFEDEQAYEQAMGVEPNTNPDAGVNQQNDGVEETEEGEDGGFWSNPYGSDSDNNNDDNDSGGIVDSIFDGFGGGGNDDSGGGNDNGGGDNGGNDSSGNNDSGGDGGGNSNGWSFS